MNITNFDFIRLGEYPFGVDVGKLPNVHSSYGVVVNAHCYGVKEESPHLLLYKSNLFRGLFRLVVLNGLWDLEEQLEELGDVEEVLFLKRGGVSE